MIEDARPDSVVAAATETAAVAAPSPKAGPPRRRAVWLGVAGFSALTVVGAVGVPVFARVDEHSASSTWTTSRTVAAVQVELAGGDVNVVPGPSGAVTLLESLTWNTARPRIIESWQGDTLIITEACSSHSVFAVNDCGAALRLSLPATVPVQVLVRSGQATITGMSGDVHAEARSGDIDLIDDSGYVWARAESGEVHGDGLRSQRVDASAISGDVALSFAVAPTTVTASVASGTATVVVPLGTTYRVSGQTASGNRSVENGLDDSSSTRSLVVDSVSGDVNIGYPDQYGS